jgi:clusterin-associated protein 1
VKELLKVAQLLYSASRAEEEESSSSNDKESADNNDDGMIGVTRLMDVKGARALASEITERGAKLHDLLKMEIETRAARSKSK